MSMLRRAISFLLAWGLPLTAVLTLTGVLADHVGIGRSLNDLAYDQFVNIDSRLSFAPTQVLLVYVDAELERRPDDYLRLLGRLNELGATSVGVTTLEARRWSPEQLEKLAHTPQVAVAAVNTGGVPLPTDMLQGHVEMTQSTHGVQRWVSQRNAEGLPALEWLLVERFGDRTLRLPSGEFGVAFRGGAESLPHVDADAVLAGEVTSTLVRDRYVLIGPPPHPLLPGVSTPTTSQMNILEFHGHTLNTLITETAITSAPTGITDGQYSIVARW